MHVRGHMLSASCARAGASDHERGRCDARLVRRIEVLPVGLVSLLTALSGSIRPLNALARSLRLLPLRPAPAPVAHPCAPARRRAHRFADPAGRERSHDAVGQPGEHVGPCGGDAHGSRHQDRQDDRPWFLLAGAPPAASPCVRSCPVAILDRAYSSRLRLPTHRVRSCLVARYSAPCHDCAWGRLAAWADTCGQPADSHCCSYVQQRPNDRGTR